MKFLAFRPCRTGNMEGQGRDGSKRVEDGRGKWQVEIKGRMEIGWIKGMERPSEMSQNSKPNCASAFIQC